MRLGRMVGWDGWYGNGKVRWVDEVRWVLHLTVGSMAVGQAGMAYGDSEVRWVDSRGAVSSMTRMARYCGWYCEVRWG